MKESIYTIPISEAFEAPGGCPLCAIRTRLEERWVEYITGPAMMEPEVRIQTNEKGFCRRHYEKTLRQQNRLSVALMLQTRLEYLKGEIGSPPKRGILPPKTESPCGCFICESIDREFGRILENIAVVWARESDFRDLYARQVFICLPDYKRVTAAARQKLRGRDLSGFLKAAAALAGKPLSALKENIDAFCGLYDYRKATEKGAGEKTADAIEKAIGYLTAD